VTSKQAPEQAGHVALVREAAARGYDLERDVTPGQLPLGAFDAPAPWRQRRRLKAA